MRLLLESHALFWMLTDNPKLSYKARSLILSDDNDVFFSPVSLYELTFKAHRGRMPLEAMHLPESVNTSGLQEPGLTSIHLIYAARLDWNHGDPWDRILLARATLEDMRILSIDETFDGQSDRRLW